MVVKIFPEVNSALIDAEQEENNFSSFNPESYHYDHLGRNPTSSPFSSKRVMYDNEEVSVDTIYKIIIGSYLGTFARISLFSVATINLSTGRHFVHI